MNNELNNYLFCETTKRVFIGFFDEQNTDSQLVRLATSDEILEFERTRKIRNLKSKISEEIYAKYPQTTQINVSLGIEVENKEDMLVFIQTKLSEYKVLKNRILNCDDLQNLKNIGI